MLSAAGVYIIIFGLGSLAGHHEHRPHMLVISGIISYMHVYIYIYIYIHTHISYQHIYIYIYIYIEREREMYIHTPHPLLVVHHAEHHIGQNRGLLVVL